MSPLGWLDVTDISFNALLLLEPLHLRYLAQKQPSQAMGTALAANPAVQWYLQANLSPHQGLRRRLPGTGTILIQTGKKSAKQRSPCWTPCRTG